MRYNYKDHSGETINGVRINYRIKDKVFKSGYKQSQYNCTCFCGNEFIASYYKLPKGCGCIDKRKQHHVAHNKKDITGMKSGKLTALYSTGKKDKHNSYLWKCVCDCGNHIEVSENQIVQKQKKSCGCAQTKVVEGNRYNKLTLVKKIDKTKGLWLCDCGNYTIKNIYSVSCGQTRSCGCLWQKKYYDITGKTFNKLTAKKPLKSDYTLWACECECGNETTISFDSLTKGQRTSCGCAYKKRKHIFKSRGPKEDLTGRIINNIEIIGIADVRKDRNYCWTCKCFCGETFIAAGNALKKGLIRSCGCLISQGENEIKKLLKQKSIKYRHNYSYKDLIGPGGGRLFFDFAILDENDCVLYLIEFQGIQHYEKCGRWNEFGKQQREITDAMKKEYCKNNNIPLYEIRYDENVEIALEKIIYTETILKKKYA